MLDILFLYILDILDILDILSLYILETFIRSEHPTNPFENIMHNFSGREVYENKIYLNSMYSYIMALTI